MAREMAVTCAGKPNGCGKAVGSSLSRRLADGRERGGWPRAAQRGASWRALCQRRDGRRGLCRHFGGWRGGGGQPARFSRQWRADLPGWPARPLGGRGRAGRAAHRARGRAGFTGLRHRLRGRPGRRGRTAGRGARRAGGRAASGRLPRLAGAAFAAGNRHAGRNPQRHAHAVFALSGVCGAHLGPDGTVSSGRGLWVPRPIAGYAARHAV